jgi:hypothetical protein
MKNISDTKIGMCKDPLLKERMRPVLEKRREKEENLLCLQHKIRKKLQR